MFAHHDIPFAPVQSLPEVLDDPHFRQRETVVTDARGWDQISNPIRFADEPARPRYAPPALGQHSHEILHTLGYSKAEIVRLEDDGAIKQASKTEIIRHQKSDGANSAD